jgi:hypothetical protein
MATGSVSPDPVIQLLDNSGTPAAGYKLFTYTAGTSTKVNTYTDVGLLSANTNPIVLDSAGRCTIFLTPGTSYKFVLAPSTDSDPPTAPLWTRDNIAGVPLGSLTATDVAVTGTAGEALSAGNTAYLSDGSGGTTAGRWYKGDSSNTYSSSNAGELGMVTQAISSAGTGSILISGRVTSLVGLTAGTLYYVSTSGGLTSTPPTNARQIGVADTTTSLIVGAWAGTIPASSAVPGVVTGGAQTWAGAKTFAGTTTLSTTAVTGAATFSNAVTFTGTPPIYAPGTTTSATGTISGRVTTDFTQRANTNAAETDLSSYSMPANSMTGDGQVVRVTAFGTTAANANAKRIRMYFGATTVADSTSSITWNNYAWHIVVYIMRRTATTQKTTGMWFGAVAAATTLNNTIVAASPGETLTGAVIIKTTGLGTATNDVLQEGFIVETVG